MLRIYSIKQKKELTVNVNKDCGSVEGLYRKVVLEDLTGNRDFDITLTDHDACKSFEVGQQVLADLRSDSFKINGEWKDEYYVASILPLTEDVKVEFVEDWTVHLV